MITLYGFGKCFNVMDASPFVVKVDLFMRMANIPFQVKSGAKYLKTSPKGKLPFIDDGGKVVADSEAIVSYLTKHYQVTLDTELTSEQKAQAYLITKSLDEGLYWCLVYSRWVLDDSWPFAKKAFFGKLPAPLRWFIPSIIRRKVKNNLHGQGVGRHSPDEILAMADKSLTSLSTLLADKDFFFGEQHTSFDAVVYSHLCEFISVRFDCGFENVFTKQAKNYQNLVQFCQRIEDKFYQEK
ncbi:Tom37 metaxin N-terminal-like domain-containing protein [Colwellia sp. 12G3]|uniref:Tom37 metaxin N-terminal-like domain-containing protein n=1 Tax=Colwellia sp. 12G3 TaxID=2058299 RepID=UPI000C34B5DF|nr:glutathione S-transferase C-terminal domain-containing protein [Colwellia sp. 12G3]PKI12882.1 glutathione S-transferase [Colwellia sp. 12G3]